MPRIPWIDLTAQHRSLSRALGQAAARVLTGGRYILGPEVAALERQLAARCGVAHGIGVGSGTDALELALRASGIGPRDEVITAALSFFATAQAIASLGARPVFADIDPRFYTLDPEAAAAAVTRRTRAIVPVHLYGQPCDMAPLQGLARRRGLAVIEDCAQAIGARIGRGSVGSFGDAGALSFYPTKNLGACGDGGMVVTRRGDIARRVRILREHGSRDRVRHEVISGNSRLDELQAALLRVKLHHLDAWTGARRAIAARYDDTLAGVPGLALPRERPGTRHVYHLYVVRVPRRERVRRALAARGVDTRVHYAVPLHLEPALRSLGYRRGAFPHAERAAREVLSLPMFAELHAREVEHVADQVREVLRRL